MKRLNVLITLLVFTGIVLGGGIVTNTNQSADFIRTLNRNASTDIDAVYFNPAGVTSLGNGIHLYFSNQTINQTREVTSDVATLNAEMFEGTTSAPVFPNVYFAYVMDKLAFSGGFTPIGGGGSAKFDKGLPSFEVPVSLMVPSLAAADVTDYKMDVSFEGSSTYLGGQFAVSYKVNDMISLAAGARYFTAKNTYFGYLKDIQVKTSAGWFIPGDVLRGVALQYEAASASADTAVMGINAAITTYGFDPNTTLLTTIDGDSALINGLIAFGIDPTGYNLTYAIGAYTQAGLSADTSAMEYTAQATGLDVQTADKDVDAEKTGSGFAPLFGVYITPFDGLGIGLRYEGLAPMELTTKTTKDDVGLFPGGSKENADMPAMLGLGVSYKVMPSLRLEFDYNYYMNTGVNWDGKEDYVDNGTEMGLGAEFALSQALTLSAGFLTGTSGAQKDYQSDMSYSLNSSTMGFGAKYALNQKMALSFGFSTTSYEKFTNDGVTYYSGTTPVASGTESYNKTTTDFAIGIGYSL